ncbi:MAG: hypothetical protein WBX15_10880, partial [Thermoanaerobaculia bacterium]
VEWGGTLVPERSWWWVGLARHEVRHELRPGDGETLRIAKGGIGNADVRVDFEPGKSDSATLLFRKSQRDEIPVGAGALRSVESAFDLDDDAEILSARGAHLLGSGWLASGRWSAASVETDRTPLSASRGMIVDGRRTGGSSNNDSRSSQTAAVVAVEGTAGRGSHFHRIELELGRRKLGEHRAFGIAGDGVTGIIEGDRLIAEAAQPSQLAGRFTYDHAVVGDVFETENVALSAGLRIDRQRIALAGSTNATPWVAAHDLVAAEPGRTATAVSPRLSLTSTVGSTRRTVLIASWSRYAGRFDERVFPGRPSSAFVPWSDSNGDGVPDQDELNFGAATPGNLFDPERPSSPSLRIGRGLELPRTDEILLGGEFEISRDFTAGIHWTGRRFARAIAPRFEKSGGGGAYDRQDFEADGILSGTTPDGISWQLPRYVLRPGSVPVVDQVIRNVEGREDFQQVRFDVTKRLSSGWMLRAWTTWRGVDGSADLAPTARASLAEMLWGRNDAWVARPAGNGIAWGVSGLLHVPFVGLDFGLVAHGDGGTRVPWLVSYRDPSVGEIDVPVGYATVGAGPRFDLGVGHQWPLRDHPFRLDLQILNVADRRSVLERQTRLASGELPLAEAGAVDRVSAGREVRLSLRYTTR